MEALFEPTWDELGRLGTIAVIRTFLSFFLDREVETTRTPRNFGESLVYLGIAMLVVGIGYHMAFMNGLRRQRDSLKRAGLIHAESHFPLSLTLMVAVLLLGIGVMAIVAMVGGIGPLSSE